MEELTKLVGFGPDRWPMIVAKEAIDNALDACEEANTAPEITVAVSTKGTISVTDNGPGIRCAGSRSPDPRTACGGPAPASKPDPGISRPRATAERFLGPLKWTAGKCRFRVGNSIPNARIFGARRRGPCLRCAFGYGATVWLSDKRLETRRNWTPSRQ